MNRTHRTVVGAAAGSLALGIGLGVTGLASADPTTSPTPASPTASASAVPGERLDHHGHGGGGFGDGGLATALADKLDLDQAAVQTALQHYRDADRPSSPPTTDSDRDDAAHAERQAALAKALADELDVDEAKVVTALAEIRADRQAERAQAVEERLATAVEDGTLTQAEADAVRKAAEAGIVHVGR